MIHKTKIYIAVVLLVISSIPFVANSQEKVEECPAVITQSVLDLKANFYKELNKNITTAQPASDTLPTIFNQYRQFLQQLNSNYTSSVAEFVDEGQILGDSESATCTQFINSQKQQIAEALVLS